MTEQHVTHGRTFARLVGPSRSRPRPKPQAVGSRSVLLAAVLATFWATSARADCYDILGCSDRDHFARHFDYLAARGDGPTCEFLSLMRNMIYKQHGYCFQTARAQAEIGNQGCTITDQASVPLNRVERDNVSTIARAERLKSCQK